MVRAIIQELEVRRGEALVYRDRFDWEGPWDLPTSRWYLGDDSDPAASSAGAFITGPIARPDGVPPGPIAKAVLPLACGDTLIRWCGPAPALIRDVVAHALRLAAAWSGDLSAPHWLISSNNLGPSHWFSASPDASAS